MNRPPTPARRALQPDEPLFGTNPVGEGATGPLKLSYLEGDGYRIAIKKVREDGYAAQVVLRIVSGIPPSPELPQWKDPSSSR